MAEEVITEQKVERTDTVEDFEKLMVTVIRWQNA